MPMREINLIPEEMLLRDNLKRHLFYWGSTLVLTLLMIFCFNLYMNQKLSGGFNYLTGIEGIDSQLSSKINTIKALEEEITGLDRQMTHAGSILEKANCSMIISGFVRLMNRQTWLEGLEIAREDDSPYIIRMNGYSVNSESLGDFIERLSKEEMFTSVILRYARDAGNEGSIFDGGKNLIRFQIEFKTGG